MRCLIKIILEGVDSGGDAGGEVWGAWEQRTVSRDRETCTGKDSGGTRPQRGVSLCPVPSHTPARET